jgi:ABC-2 type transport system ATP-binding protein
VVVEFRESVDPGVFAALDGVSVLSSTGARLMMQVTGALGPVVRAIADRDPLDLVVRPADLDELFLELYGERPQALPPA